MYRAVHRINRELTKRLAASFRGRALHEMADLCILAYKGAFRVRSELLPATIAGPHSRWRFSSTNTLRVTLARRKNRTGPTDIHRKCECQRNEAMCPHRAASNRMRCALAAGQNNIFQVTYPGALVLLRDELQALGVEDAPGYGFHAFRRGFAHDMLLARTPLREVLAACDWRSSAFAIYMGRTNIDAEAVLAASADVSDAE